MEIFCPILRRTLVGHCSDIIRVNTTKVRITSVVYTSYYTTKKNRINSDCNLTFKKLVKCLYLVGIKKNGDRTENNRL